LALPDYGFRHDPMRFLAEDTTIDGAMVRTFVIGEPAAGDAELIGTRIAELLAEQNDDGSFGGRRGGGPGLAGALRELAELGADPGRPEVERAVAWLRSRPAEELRADLALRHAEPLCRLGRGDFPGLAEAVRDDAAAADWGRGCPWTLSMRLRGLWAARGIAETGGAVEDGLRWIAEHVNAAGCWRHLDPWGLVEAAALVPTPAARGVIEAALPMVLRAQREGGGFGDHSLAAFRALATHGLLDGLRKRPPLPPDWRTVREVPQPLGDYGSMAYARGALWLLDGGSNEAVAVSREVGGSLRRLGLPDGRSTRLGAFGDDLLVSQVEPKRVLRVDCDTGETVAEWPATHAAWPGAVAEVGGAIYLSDGYLFPGWVLDPARTEATVLAEGQEWPDEMRLDGRLAGPLALHLAPTTAGVWHHDYWANLLMLSGPDGSLLDFAEVPVAMGGLAWDGVNLWALDIGRQRICAIERAALPA
jgi:hypothetical protein